MYDIRLIPHENIESIIPLLQVLDSRIETGVLKERLHEMVQRGYECVGVFDGDRLIGVSGLWILTKYYVGRHLEPDNVVIHPDYRGRGIGEKLSDWISEYGKSKGCVASELNCYAGNAAGHAFWHARGYKILGFHYQLKL